MTDVRLGRRARPHDDRDYRLADFLDPLDVALGAVLASHAAKATKAYLTVANPIIKAARVTPVPAPTPVPTPVPAPVGEVLWTDTDDVLDQGQTPHCVGFASAQWGNTLPVDDHFGNSDGDAIYAACKKIDGAPDEDGTDVRSAAKVLRTMGRVKAYAFAGSVDEVIAFVVGHGPVVIGSDWYNRMFTPDAQNFVFPAGTVAGGHAYLCIGYMPETDALVFLNSWGTGFGDRGRFFMHTEDFGRLLAAQGDAMAAVELPTN